MDTTRSIKQKSEFSRPDKGERVKIRILLRIETIKFDGTVDRIRIGGTILNSDNQLVPKGVHHSISIKVDDMIILEKKQWKKIQAFFFQAEDGIRVGTVTGVQTCALPI